MMPIFRISLLAFALVSSLIVSSPWAQMASGSFVLAVTDLNSGGNRMSSSAYQMGLSLGQPTPVGWGSNNSYELTAGFWGAVVIIACGDVDGDGSVTLEDFITVLQVITGQTPERVAAEADSDGDGRIGIGEALGILRKLGG